MSFEHRPSPARVTEAAAAKLPRWMLLALLIAYAVPGLFGRDPWSLEDASAFGVMWTMAQGNVAEWLLPGVVGQPLPEEGPLPFWAGAMLIRAFGGLLGAVDAARLTSVLWFALATSSLWYATYRLARRAEAQPVALAFGGEASPRDYGRMLADIAVLLMLATFGIVVRLHETVAETALFAWVSVLLLALTLLYPGLVAYFTRVEWGPILSGYLGLVLTGAVFLAVGVLVSSLTENQIVAGFGTFGILLAFWIVGWGAEFAGGNLRGVLQYLAIGDHLDSFTRGLIDTKDLIYYLTGVALALFLTLRSLESKRWRG